MTALPKINQDYLLSRLEKLLNIPSPTGYTDEAINFVSKELESFKDVESSTNKKDALVSSGADGTQLSCPPQL